VIELRLRATWPLEATTRQLHGLACAVFEGQHADGHAGGEKPFTVWPLSPDPEEPGTGWLLRTAWLRSGLPQAVLAAYGQLRLGHVTCKVADVAYQPATHAELAAGPSLEGARLAFLSPTYFSQNGTDVLIPEPRLIVGSWRRRWNASLPGEDHPLAISDEAWRDIHRALRLTAFELRTQRMDSGRGHERAGFTGTATLRLDKDAGMTVQAPFGALARFAGFCGTGAQTTHGFGATTTQPLPEGRGGLEGKGSAGDRTAIACG
jgi:CRISPR-associated endoribonuclease Cas6